MRVAYAVRFKGRGSICVLENPPRDLDIGVVFRDSRGACWRVIKIVEDGPLGDEEVVTVQVVLDRGQPFPEPKTGQVDVIKES